MTPITVVRRRNALALCKDFMERQLAAGSPPKGLEQAFAAHLQISPSMWSQIKSARPIGDTLARQIEVLCAKEPQWLDTERAADVVDEAEAHFLELARAAWRAANARRKRELLRDMRALGL